MLQWTFHYALLDNCSKLSAHAKWVHNKEKLCVNTVSSDVEKFDELQSLLFNMNQQGQGDSTKTCINEVIDKICDLFKCTAKRVFPNKNRNSPVINLINLGSINRALKSVVNFTL
jgi:hypothetical protein